VPSPQWDVNTKTLRFLDRSDAITFQAIATRSPDVIRATIVDVFANQGDRATAVYVALYLR
jgi:hypothetical protein